MKETQNVEMRRKCSVWNQENTKYFPSEYYR